MISYLIKAITETVQFSGDVDEEEGTLEEIPKPPKESNRTNRIKENVKSSAVGRKTFNVRSNISPIRPSQLPVTEAKSISPYEDMPILDLSQSLTYTNPRTEKVFVFYHCSQDENEEDRLNGLLDKLKKKTDNIHLLLFTDFAAPLSRPPSVSPGYAKRHKHFKIDTINNKVYLEPDGEAKIKEFASDETFYTEAKTTTVYQSQLPGNDYSQAPMAFNTQTDNYTIRKTYNYQVQNANKKA